ncbi:hypothetical protein BS78_10G119800 [Paspalum vaginatum]|nr:hypothetical protein BS78_10G119800 [Paspalum vaginatum]
MEYQFHVEIKRWSITGYELCRDGGSHGGIQGGLERLSCGLVSIMDRKQAGLFGGEEDRKSALNGRLSAAGDEQSVPLHPRSKRQKQLSVKGMYMLQKVRKQTYLQVEEYGVCMHRFSGKILNMWPYCLNYVLCVSAHCAAIFGSCRLSTFRTVVDFYVLFELWTVKLVTEH